MLNAVIVELFRAVDSHDWQGLRKVFHPEIVYERLGYEPFAGIRAGDALLSARAHPRLRGAPDRADRGRGRSRGLLGRFVGAKKDGSPADERFVDVYSFEDGRIRTRRSYFFRPAV